jgi:arylsulfatase A-like enzyme
MRRPVRLGTLALAGMAAGFVVGIADGLMAGRVMGADARGSLFAALLAGSVDGLLGTAAGVLSGILLRFSLWGRRARPAGWALIVATVVVGVLNCVAAVALTIATVDRRDRFLAAGLSALLAFGGGLVAAAMLPAIARGLDGRGAVGLRPLRFNSSSLLFLTPLAVAVIDAVIFVAASAIRAPFGSRRGIRHLVVIGVEAGLLPMFLTWAQRIPGRVRLMWAAPLASIVFGGPIVFFIRANWANHLRFVPWVHILPGVVIVTVTIATVPMIKLHLRVRAAARAAIAVGGAVSMIVLTLVTSESETARKVTSARAGLVAPVLVLARRLLDRDHDGYPRLLGGGDCDDTDPTVHPGVLDFPDDGIDQDCDGKDASISILTPPPFAPLPATVPHDLNLLLVTLDTVRADHLGCYGYPRPTSPAIDRLAGEGALFLNGWAHAPSTRYSMPAIATGRWPTAIAWDESIWWPRMAQGVRTIAEALKDVGYFTAAFYSYDYFSPADRRGFERGVDVYRADRARLHQAVNGPMESHGSSSREMADDSIAFLEGHQKQKFFLWVHFYDPHLSYEPHPEVPSFGTSRIDLYDGEIRFTDLHLGRVLERLRTLGLWDRTAIVVTGDHGEGFGEHGVTEHGFDLYAAQTKVPLIIRVPGLGPRRITVPAGHVDLAPTLLNLAGAAQYGERDGEQDRENDPGDKHRTVPGFLGRSLIPELAGTNVTVPGASPPTVFQEVTSERGKKRAFVTEDLHLIWNWTPDNTTECYDLRADPNERRDLWGRSTDAGCRRLKSDLQGMVSALSVPPDVAQKLRQSVFPAGAPVPVPTISIDATIGDVVKVVGATLTPGAMTPGGEAELSILFECKRTATDGWRFFFHLMGPGGSFRNLDHVPVDGAMPPERWRPGQRILDRLRIPFPPGTPHGAYNVIIGMFRGGDRLPIAPVALSDGKKALRIVTIAVP